jgi:hypothetical protein
LQRQQRYCVTKWAMGQVCISPSDIAANPMVATCGRSDGGNASTPPQHGSARLGSIPGFAESARGRIEDLSGGDAGTFRNASNDQGAEARNVGGRVEDARLAHRPGQREHTRLRIEDLGRPRGHASYQARMSRHSGGPA